jgi:hypothetical protein
MSTETVMIGCRLPHGLKLEVGYKTTRKGSDGKVFSHYERLPNYASVVLKGTNEHVQGARAQGIQLPAVGNPEPFINRNVSKDLWEQWMKEHPRNWYLKSGNIFVVPGSEEASAKAISTEVMSTQAPLAPLNVTVDAKTGKIMDPRAPKKTEKHDGIATANFKD